jgi:hypothetical protein
MAQLKGLCPLSAIEPQPHHLGLADTTRFSQGSSRLATLICSLYMIYLRSSALRQSLSSTAPWECFSLRRSTEASVASRSGTAQREAAAEPSLRQSRHPLRVCPHLVTALLSISCFSCAGKKMRPVPLRKGQSAACASSCNPWTAFGQSVAQPEPRTPMLRTRTVAGAAAQPVSSYK